MSFNLNHNALTVPKPVTGEIRGELTIITSLDRPSPPDSCQNCGAPFDKAYNHFGHVRCSYCETLYQ